MDVLCLTADTLQQEIGAPHAEGVCLFPCHSHNGIVVIGRIIEIELHIALVVGILEVVDPAGRVREDVHDVSVQEVPRTSERTSDGLTNNLAVVINPSRILADHHSLITNGIVRSIGIQVALFRVQAILTLGGSSIVIDLIAIVHLTGIQHLCPVDGMNDIDTLDGTLFVLICLLPGDSLVPVEVGSDGVALLILLNLVGLVATIGGVSQTLADNAIANPVDKLAILGIGDFRLVHPETVD